MRICYNTAIKKERELQMDNSDIAKLIKKLREELQLSQRQFAKLVGKPHSTIARIENGNMSPTVSLLQDIASSIGKELRITFID